jgi:hypothetical protein
MKKLFFAVFLTALLFPLTAIAQSKFDGTWKVEKHQPSKKPYVFSLRSGTFHCTGCVPAWTVPADGQDHAVKGSPYYDALNVKVASDGAIGMLSKKDGKTVITRKLSLSADGKTLKIAFNDASATNSAPVTGVTTLTRLSAGPAGSSPISGSWAVASFSQSDNGATFTLKVEGDSVTMTTPTGQSYTAKLGGPDAPYKGDPGTTSVSVKRLSADTIEETDKRDGKSIDVLRMTVGADGKTMTIVNTDLPSGRISHDTAMKQ